MGAVIRVAKGVLPPLLGSVLFVALVMGAAGGLATGLASGGIRARTAVERLIVQTHLPDVMLSDPTLDQAQVDEIRNLPEVQGAALLTGFALAVPGGDYVNITASIDGRYGIELDVPNLVDGRLASSGVADEVVLTEGTAEALDVGVGDVLHFKSYSPEQVASWAGRETTDEEMAEFAGPDVDVEVVGITRHPADLTSDDPIGYFVALPPGFYEEYHGRIGEFFPFAMIDVGSAPTPAEQAAVAAATQRIAGSDASFEEAGEQAGAPLIATLDFVGLAMIVLAGAIALAGVIVGGLLVSRTVTRAAFESAPLVALGMTNTGRATAITIAFAPAALVAGVLTAVVTVGSTAFLPFGLARRADPNRGMRFDLPPIALGVVATVITVVVTVAALAFREVSRRGVQRARRSSAVDRLARAGMPVSPLVGVDLAVGSGGSGPAAGNQFAAAAVAMASAAGIGALVLSASIAQLESTPEAYGWMWDFVLSDAETGPIAVDGEDSDLEMVAVVSTGAVSLDGRPVIVRGMDSIKGPPPVLVLDGRPPGNGEIVLGRRTMDDLDVDIGDELLAEGGEDARRFRVVGEAVFAGIIDVPEASWGAAMQASDFEQLGAGIETGSGTVIGLAGGADRDAFAQRLEAGEFGEVDWQSAPDVPVELARLREIEALPWILTGFLGVVGLVAVVNAVVTTSRRRARHLAVLRSIGLAPTSVRVAVTTQSVVLAVMGLVVGVPLGLVIGPMLWRALAESLGVVVLVDVPWAAVLTSSVAGVVAAAVLAFLPGRTAARRSIAGTLRTE